MRRSLIIALAAILTASAAHADQRIYSYEPADEATRKRLGAGLTIVFDKGPFSMLVKEVLATEATAVTIVEPAIERDLGVKLAAVLPQGAGERELYRIVDREQGPGMVRAFCPGSTKGWLVFAPLRPRRGLVVHALGNDPATGKARYCTTLTLSFRGEWQVPQRRTMPTTRSVEPPRPPF